MNKKARIDTYSTMYDMDFVVANENVKLNELRKLFEEQDGSELDECYEKWDGCCGTVIRKKDKAKILLVKFNRIGEGFVSSGDKTLDIIDTCAHEAVHVALDIYNCVNAKIDTDNQENFAYFVAYITERIAKTLLNK